MAASKTAQQLHIELERRVGRLTEFSQPGGPRIPQLQVDIAGDLQAADQDSCVDAAAKAVLIVAYLYEPGFRAAAFASALDAVDGRLPAATLLADEQLRRDAEQARRALADALNQARRQHRHGAMTRALHSPVHLRAQEAAVRLASCSLALAAA